ncbi:MAG TPA: hypothetical protein VME40_09595 [Caulobacteraceae bacterium]|nr:hypothetical protein [Caulobacteraceae bacterium]
MTGALADADTVAPAVPAAPEGLTADWVSAALGAGDRPAARVATVRRERIGARALRRFARLARSSASGAALALLVSSALAQSVPPTPHAEWICPNGRLGGDGPRPACGGGTGPRPAPHLYPRPNNVANSAPDPAVAEVSQGDALFALGNWSAALWHYRRALALHPTDAHIQGLIATATANQDRDQAEARDRAANADAADKINALLGGMDASLARQRQDAAATASIDAIGNAMDGATRRNDALAGPAEGLPILSPNARPVLFAALHHPIPGDSAPAEALIKAQPSLRELDLEIARTETALRRLVVNNEASSEQHREWERESAEATADAESIGLGLVIDLAGAHVDHLTEQNEEQASEALDELMQADPLQPVSDELRKKGEQLIAQRDRLQNEADSLRAIGKEADLYGKIDDTENHGFTREDLYEVITQMKKVEDLAGPYKDLLDAAYTVYRQADSLDHLAVADVTDERTLQASASLRRTLYSLVAQRQALRTGLKARKTTP